jgi:ribosome biogenesis GTPase / thiamine phosphate phosphatase
MNQGLQNLGYDQWFISHEDAALKAAHKIARVVSVHKESYLVSTGSGEVFAELSGHLSYTANSIADLPTTGDWVYADFFDDNTLAIIHAVIPRKTLLKRKTPGKRVDFQLIAANIDVAFIIQSLDENLNLRRLERYLVMVYKGGITPVVLLSKSDLVTAEALEEIKLAVSSVAPQLTTLAYGHLNEASINAVKKLLSPGQTYCLIGSSGVGKTTLLNCLVGEGHFATQTVSKKASKGRHTTTSRELVQLANGVMIIDTPGMRELGNLSIDAGMEETFSEIIAMSVDCKFKNCSHLKEKGCAILAAVDAGELSRQRYQNYLKMKNENAFNEMSYVEKRQKDKAFGKMIKSTLKGKKK